MNSQATTPLDVQKLLSAMQPAVLGYILRMVPNVAEAEEILQNTNYALLQKQTQLLAADEPTAWACRVAYYETLTWRKRQARDKARFSTECVQSLAAAPPVHSADEQRHHLRAMQHCLSLLAESQRSLLVERYQHGRTAEQLGEQTGDTAATMRQRLRRIRLRLEKCISVKLMGGFDE